MPYRKRNRSSKRHHRRQPKNIADRVKHIKNQNELNDVCMEAVELHYQINHIH